MIKFIILMLLTASCATMRPCHQLEKIEERAVCYEQEKQNQYDLENRWRYHYPEPRR
jgi:hypothetical protein